jgi:hypothetical protein
MPMPSPTSASDPPTPMPPDSLLSKNSSSIPPFRIIRRAETQPIPSSTHFNNGAMNTMNGPTLYPATPRQSNPSLHPIESIPINTNAYESPTILSETPPDGLMQRRSSTFSDSFLSLKPNQHEDPFSDLFAYEDIPNKEEKTQVQDTSRHKKSVSEPPNLSRPQGKRKWGNTPLCFC